MSERSEAQLDLQFGTPTQQKAYDVMARFEELHGEELVKALVDVGIFRTRNELHALFRSGQDPRSSDFGNRVTLDDFLDDAYNRADWLRMLEQIESGNADPDEAFPAMYGNGNIVSRMRRKPR